MRSRLPQPPRRRYPALFATTVIWVAAELVFGILLGIVVIAIADIVPAGPWRTVVSVIVLAASFAVVASTSRTVRAGGRRRLKHDPSTNSQAHNLSIRGLTRRFRRD